MVLLSALEIVPVVIAVLMAALAAIFTRILSMEEAYRAIHWSSLVLIAGMLPIATAMVKTGGVDLIVEGMISGVGGYGAYAMMTALFFLSAGLGLFLSNTATAVLMAPIAIRAAEAMSVSPYAFAMTVAIAASAAYATPVSTPVVTLVVEPGHYRFIDFVKVGIPMMFLTWLVTLLVTPILFSF
jgi:di/tricarboxylate transporter